MLNILNLLRQTSSIIGLAVGAPAVTAAATGALTWQQALPALVGSAVAILVPEKAQAPTQDAAAAVATAISDVVKAVTTVGVAAQQIAPAAAAVAPAAPAPVQSAIAAAAPKA